MPPRFKVKRHPVDAPVRSPWILKDRDRPAFLGQYATDVRAYAAMDNIVRAERGMLPRLAITRREIRDAMHKEEATS